MAAIELSRHLLDENNQLIQCIMDFQSKGKTSCICTVFDV
uniref:SS18 N-terminal domain-containing protein n=1 Tax=Sinocyclocheilus rhinocerous TaxID=307959 RepID=A0A673LXL1_9TELE